MPQVSPDILNSMQTLLLITILSSHFSWRPPCQKKGSFNLQPIIMRKSNDYHSPRKSSVLSLDKNFRDAVVASTMPRVNVGSGMWSALDELVADKQVILTPYRFSCCSKVFPCDKYDYPLDISTYLFTCLLIYLDATTRKPITPTNTQIAWYVATAPASKSTGPRTAVSAKRSWLARQVVGSGRVEKEPEIGLWWVGKVCHSFQSS